MTDRYKLYLEYLESAHWKALRDEALNKAGRKCEACKSPKKLRGHHLLYRDDLTSHTVDEIMCLCEPCHDLWHKWLKENRKKVGDFCRQSTRGGILVLLTIRVDKPIAERPTCIPLNPKATPKPPKISKSERKRQRAAVRAMEKESRKIQQAQKQERKKKRSTVKTNLLAMPEFVDVLTTSKTRDEFKKRLRALTFGWDNRNSILAHAWVIHDRGIRPAAVTA